MANPNFTSVLDKPATSIEEPKPMPLGTYIGAVQGSPKMREVGKTEKFDVIDFNLKLISPYKDVDQSALQEWGDLSVARPLQKSVFYGTPEGDWNLIQFLTDHLGIDPTNKTVRQMLPEASGKQCLVVIKHEPYVDANNKAKLATKIAATAKM